ncbi:MAG: carboxypeptidase-like regulatory domain-containing protein, partial [Bacteroidota bacterium]
MKNIVLLCSLLVFTGFSVWGQTSTVTGNVTDGDGIPLVGASVIAKGTTVGTLTDEKGFYSIAVPNGVDTLVYRYTGFGISQVPIGGRSTISVTLNQDLVIEEVVITALGIEKEAKTLGYGVDNIEAEELTRARSTNLVNALQGKVTGVNIGNTDGNLGGSS